MSHVDRHARQILGGRLPRAENLDRNTLNTLHLLLTEKSVTRTAMLLGQSQPAVSEVLARLRKLTGDRLLVRSGAGMELTDHARSLCWHVERALSELDRIALKRGEFDPRRCDRTFRIATADNLDVRFHAGLAARLRRHACGARLEAFSLTQEFDHARKLGEGVVDVVVANWPEPPAHLHLGMLCESDIVCLMSRSHPLARVPLSWETYRHLAHVDITPRMLGEVSPIDVHLLKLGIRRSIRLHYPFFGLIPHMVAQTDLVFTASRRFLMHFEASLPVVIRDMPAPLPPVRFYQLWHERTNASPECRWLREQVRASVAQLAAA